MQERQVVAIPGLGSSTLTGEDTPEIDTVQFLRRSKQVFVGLSLMYVCVCRDGVAELSLVFCM